MYRNILIPIAGDQTETTARALEAAKVLADEGAKITALTVLESVPGYVAAELPGNIVADSRDHALAELRHVVGEDIETVVLTGHAARTINDHAAASGADCIVIASHRPGLSDYFLGSTAAHVVRHAPCSVHVVR